MKSLQPSAVIEVLLKTPASVKLIERLFGRGTRYQKDLAAGCRVASNSL